MAITCGIDWAENHHDVALVDEAGKLVAKRRISDNAEGYRQLLQLLVEAGDTAQDPIPVAIETARGLLISCLRATGRAVYSINPMAVARYRERHRVARAKSDHADAMALANILRTDADMHRPLPADSELAQAIAVLARAQQDATLWFLRYRGTELDDGVAVVGGSPAQTQAKIDQYVTGESIDGADVVIWYAGHFRHDEQNPQPHQGHIVGPELRPINW